MNTLGRWVMITIVVLSMSVVAADDSLWLYYPFEESLASSGYLNLSAMSEYEVGYETGVVGNYSVDKRLYVNLTGEELVFSGDELTFTMWFRANNSFDASSDYMSLFVLQEVGAIGTTKSRWEMYFYPYDVWGSSPQVDIGLFIANDTTNLVTDYSEAVITDYEGWHFLSLRASGVGGVTSYVVVLDNVTVFNDSFSYGLGDVSFDWLGLGEYRTDLADSISEDGLFLDDIRLYNRSLSDSELEEVYLLGFSESSPLNNPPVVEEVILYSAVGAVINPDSIIGLLGTNITVAVLASDADNDSLTASFVVKRPDSSVVAVGDDLLLDGVTNISNFLLDAYGAWVFEVNISDGLDNVVYVQNFSVVNTPPLISSLLVFHSAGGTCFAGDDCYVEVVVGDECFLPPQSVLLTVNNPVGTLLLEDVSWDLFNESLLFCSYRSSLFSSSVAGGYDLFASVVDGGGLVGNRSESWFIPAAPSVPSGGGGGAATLSVCPVVVHSSELVFRSGRLSSVLELENLLSREQFVDLSLVFAFGETALPGSVAPSRVFLRPLVRERFVVEYVPVGSSEVLIDTEMRLLVGGVDCLPVEVPVFFRVDGSGGSVFSVSSFGGGGDGLSFSFVLISFVLLLLLFGYLVFK